MSESPAPVDLQALYRDQVYALQKWCDEHDRVPIGMPTLVRAPDQPDPNRIKYVVAWDTVPVNTVKLLGMEKVLELAAQAKGGVIT